MELPVKRVWRQNLTKIRRMCSRGAQAKTSVLRPSSTAGLPPDIFEIIIAHLIYDTPSLLACSLTCSSWYIAVAPHLHQTLTILTAQWPKRQFMWPKPLRHMHRLGLLPLVKRLQVHEGCLDDQRGLTPKRFDRRTLRYFFALTNVRELEIDHLDIPKFMPRIRQYFENFSPTLRSLALKQPKGSHQHILYFIGLFQHLEDLKLCYEIPHCPQQPVDGPPLIPPFAPPLRGRLTMTSVKNVNLLNDMVHLFGGIRFRYVDLFNVWNTRLWMDACAETSETLRLYPTAVNTPAGLLSFNLSRHKSLRTLEVPASCVYGAFHCNSPGIAVDLLKHVLSTITSPAFFEIVVVYRDYDFCGVESPWHGPTRPPLYRVSQAKRASETIRHHAQFGVFREIHKVRDFRLVLRADVWDGVGEYSVRELEEAVAVEDAKGGLDEEFPEPSVTYSPRESQTTLGQDFFAGHHPCATALAALRARSERY